MFRGLCQSVSYHSLCPHCFSAWAQPDQQSILLFQQVRWIWTRVPPFSTSTCEPWTERSCCQNSPAPLFSMQDVPGTGSEVSLLESITYPQLLGTKPLLPLSLPVSRSHFPVKLTNHSCLIVVSGSAPGVLKLRQLSNCAS